MIQPPPYARPTLMTTVDALRTRDARFPHVAPTDEEEDIACVLEAIEQQHPAGADESDTGDYFGSWGDCQGCGEPWPCPEFRRGEQLAVLWLGRAADRVSTHARSVMDRGRTA